MTNHDAPVTSDNPFGDQETTDLTDAWWRSFYMVERWSDDGQKPIELIYGGNRLQKARDVYDAMVRYCPAGRYTLRQRARTLRQWPDD